MFSLNRKLSNIRSRADVIPFDNTSKFIFMSDCHRGQGTLGDNFLPNQLLFSGALQYYFENGFTYIELGDGDELWENKKLLPIIEAHSNAYALMAQFYKQQRFYMLYGNHDIVKRRRLTAQKHYKTYFCEKDTCIRPLLPGITVREGLVLEHRETGQQIFLVHGHQGSLLNDTLWPLARFLVRYVWKPLEAIGFRQPSAAWRAPHGKEKIEKKLSAYAEEARLFVIAGHTHRPYFPAPGKGRYFNDGCCVHPRYITGIEVENGCISLVKWEVDIRPDRSMYIARNVQEGPLPLEAFSDAATKASK